MSLTNEEQNHNFASILRDKLDEYPGNNEHLQSTLQIDLLQAMIESFVDGILIMTTERELIHANECAHHICRQLIPKETNTNTIPEEIWRVCQSLIESRELFPGEKIIIESDIETAQTLKLRIRARWLQLDASNHNLLLVTIEDYNQSSQSIAIADAKKYHLTDREAQIWQLRRDNLSYQQIANQLYITINTVKKHLKNIYAKQQNMLWSTEA